jgi:hypothetical protein
LYRWRRRSRARSSRDDFSIISDYSTAGDFIGKVDVVILFSLVFRDQRQKELDDIIRVQCR